MSFPSYIVQKINSEIIQRNAKKELFYRIFLLNYHKKNTKIKKESDYVLIHRKKNPNIIYDKGILIILKFTLVTVKCNDIKLHSN